MIDDFEELTQPTVSKNVKKSPLTVRVGTRRRTGWPEVRWVSVTMRYAELPVAFDKHSTKRLIVSYSPSRRALRIVCDPRRGKFSTQHPALGHGGVGVLRLPWLGRDLVFEEGAWAVEPKEENGWLIVPLPDALYAVCADESSKSQVTSSVVTSPQQGTRAVANPSLPQSVKAAPPVTEQLPAAEEIPAKLGKVRLSTSERAALGLLLARARVLMSDMVAAIRAVDESSYAVPDGTLCTRVVNSLCARLNDPTLVRTAPGGYEMPLEYKARIRKLIKGDV